jgi:hypothetical protein
MGGAVTAPLLLLPDAERMLSSFLRDNDDVIAQVDDRVYTVMPRDGVDKKPFVRLRLLGGPPRRGPMRWSRTARIQIDVWATLKNQASLIAETIAAAIATGMVGTQPDGVVSAADVEEPAYNPDPDLSDPPTPRYTFDVMIDVHPHRTPGTTS